MVNFGIAPDIGVDDLEPIVIGSWSLYIGEPDRSVGFRSFRRDVEEFIASFFEDPDVVFGVSQFILIIQLSKPRSVFLIM